MDPIIIVPLAAAALFFATRKKKKANGTNGSGNTPGLKDPFGPGGEVDDPTGGGGGGGGGPAGPRDPVGPGTDLPNVDDDDNGGDNGDNGPIIDHDEPVDDFPYQPWHVIDIEPGTTADDIATYPNSNYGIYITTDCAEVFIGDDWIAEIFMPAARALVLELPNLFHSAPAVVWQIMIAPFLEEGAPVNYGADCLSMAPDFNYSLLTPEGYFSGGMKDGYWDARDQFAVDYPELNDLYNYLYWVLWNDPDINAIFDQDWPEVDPELDNGIDFDQAS